MKFFDIIIIKIFILSIILTEKTNAQEKCPKWIVEMENTPTCPDYQLLPDTYPVMGIVFPGNSHLAGKSSAAQKDFNKEFGFQLLTTISPTINSGNLPMIILPSDTFASLEKKIKEKIKDLDLQEYYLKHLVKFNESTAWSQDAFQSYVDIKTGLPILDDLSAYGGDPFNQQRAENIAKYSLPEECGAKYGKTSGTKEMTSGGYGGNIEGFPGGLCVVGDDHLENWKKFAKSVCKNSKPVQISTSWLKVGHTDEIIKPIPNNQNQAPCDFSIAIASPSKAFELLKLYPNELFLNYQRRESETEEGFYKRLSHSTSHTGFYQLCSALEKMGNTAIKPQNIFQPPKKIVPETRQVLHFNLYNFIISSANAQPEEPAWITPYDKNTCPANLTNKDVVSIIENDESLNIYQKLVQAEMDKIKIKLTNEYKQRRPSCKIDFIDVPDFFFGPPPVKKGNNYELPKEGGHSILPNPTNSVLIDNVIFSPDQTNKVFNQYLSDEYKARGIRNTSFFDTSSTSHPAYGNLHCLTNTINFCKPKVKNK